MTKPNLSFKIERIEPFLIIYLKGRFDYDGFELRKDKLSQLAKKNDSMIIVDLSKVSYLSSRGLGFLVSLYDHAKKHNGEVRITGLQDSIKSVFEKTGYFNIFNLFDSLEDAKKLQK